MSPKTRWVSDPRQISVLSSRVRQRLMDRLEAIGPASVAELAASLGVAPDRLYYHVRLLEQHELVRRAGSRGSGRNEEALYDLGARQWHIAYDLEDPEHVEALDTLTGTMCRQAHRDFAAGLGSPRATVRGKRRNLWSLRLEAALTREELAEVNDHLGRIVEILRKPKRESTGDLVALTWVLAPLQEGS